MVDMVKYRENPVHIFADTAAALASMRGTAQAADCRIIAALQIGDGADPGTGASLGGAILIELEMEEAGEAAIPLLDWLRSEAERGRRGVISAPAGLIDLVAARCAHAGIEHLCEADETERQAAVVRACRQDGTRVHDAGRDMISRVLQPPPKYRTDFAGPAAAAFIRAMIRARRRREQHLPADLFADPVWDMLLDLMAARQEGKQVAISSLCVAAAVPPTTALRWIGVLAERGLVVRIADPGDGRRAFVALTQDTASALHAWLSEARAIAVEVL